MGGVLSNQFSPTAKSAVGCQVLVSLDMGRLRSGSVAYNWDYACFAAQEFPICAGGEYPSLDFRLLFRSSARVRAVPASRNRILSPHRTVAIVKSRSIRGEVKDIFLPRPEGEDISWLSLRSRQHRAHNGSRCRHNLHWDRDGPMENSSRRRNASSLD